MREGETVVVKGRVRCDASIKAFSSHRDSAYYELIEVVRSGSDGVWIERARAHRGVDFGIVDDSGEALVIVEGAEVLLMKDHELQHGIAARREGIVAEGDVVAVVGTARRELDPRPSRATSYRDATPVLVMRSTWRRPLRITNSPAVLQSIAIRRH